MQVAAPAPVYKSKEVGVLPNKVSVLEGADGVVRYVLAFLVEPAQQAVASNGEQLVAKGVAALKKPAVDAGLDGALLAQGEIARRIHSNAGLVGFKLYCIIEAFELEGRGI